MKFLIVSYVLGVLALPVPLVLERDYLTIAYTTLSNTLED